MKKILIAAFVLVFFLLSASNIFAQIGIYAGFLGGFSAQKPSLEGVEFDTNTKFLYGVRAGVRFLMIVVEANYFQAAHNIELRDFLFLNWQGRQVDYNFLGLNLKYMFSFLMLHPYLTFGYGSYEADIHDIDEDKGGGYNFGLGMEVMLGKKISFLVEGKYHHVKLDIQHQDFGLGDFTLSGGLNIYF